MRAPVQAENMMGKIIPMLLLLMVSSPGWSIAQEGENQSPIIMTGHPDRPPFIYQDGERIVGFGPDFAAIVLSNMGIPYERRFVGPWKRVQELARQGEVDLIAGLYRNSEREAYLAFSETFFEDPSAVFVKKTKPFFLSSHLDLVGWRGVTLFGDSFGDPLDRFIEDRLRMNRVYSLDEMFDLLLKEKADYIIFGHYAGIVAASQLGISDEIIVAKKNLVVENVYLALSKKSPHIHLLPDINREIRRLREEGRIEDLINEHMRRFTLKTQ